MGLKTYDQSSSRLSSTWVSNISDWINSKFIINWYQGMVLFNH